MVQNLYVVGNVQKLLETELDYINKNVEKNIANRKKRLALKRNTPWGQLANPKTKIGHYYEKYGELFAISGFTFDSLVFAALTFSGMMFVTSSYINNPKFMKCCEDWIKNIVQYAKYPVIISLPFLGTDILKKSIRDKFYTEERIITKKQKSIEMRKKFVENALIVVQDSFNDKSKTSFLKDFLENVDLNENTILYNKELIILLSQVSKNPTSHNLKCLADFLRSSISSEISTSSHTASPKFLKNEKVMQITKNY